MNLYKTGFIFLYFFLAVLPAKAAPFRTRDINSIYTAVPFLTIAPDSRASAMGDVGVATSPDVNSLQWNPAKYAFIKASQSVALSYSPWLRGLVNDMDLLYLTGYKRIDRLQLIAASLRYFNMGSINFTNDQAQSMGIRNPNEFAIDAAYSRMFSEKISAALAFRYIRSDISAGISNSAAKAKAGNSFAADVAIYYHSTLQLPNKTGEWALGANISNIGNKMSYSNEQQKTFIPVNLRIGGSAGINLDSYNKLTLAVDLNKLLVPTPPVFDQNGVIIGMSRDVSLVQGIFQSFYDAPGGFPEEMNEITYGIGLEYLYREMFALRTGYFHENPLKGNRRYFTMGVGFDINMIGLDFSYLVATHGRQNPLNNTLRFTFRYSFGKNPEAS